MRCGQDPSHIRPSFLCGASGGTELSTAPHSSLPCWCGPSRGYESFAHRRPCCCLLFSDIPRGLVSGGSPTPTASLGFCLLHLQLKGNLYIWPFRCKGSKSSDWANCGRKCSENNRVCWHVLAFLLSQYAVYIVLGECEDDSEQMRGHVPVVYKFYHFTWGSWASKTFDGLWGPGINPQWSINDVLLFYLLRHLMIHVLFTHLFIYF